MPTASPTRPARSTSDPERSSPGGDRQSERHEAPKRGRGQGGQAQPLADGRLELARQESLLSLLASSPRLQRQCACGAPSAGGGSCAACEEKASLQGLQRKALAIGAADDPLEREADQVAERVMRMEAPVEVPLGMDQHVRPRVSRSTNGGAVAGEAPASVHSTLASQGQALAPSERDFFEPRFGADFSQVRVHTDDLAQQSARDVKALAYTVGSHVVFGAGRYAPSSPEGQRLLAHELAHVVQQSQAELRVRRQTQESGVCNPNQLGMLGPAFRKSKDDVKKMGLEEKYVIQRPTPDKDFVLYCPHQSTRPLKKLFPCTNVYWIGDAGKKASGKDEVWAQQEGDGTNLYRGFVKNNSIQKMPCQPTLEKDGPDENGKVEFRVLVPAGLKAEDYGLVQQFQGCSVDEYGYYVAWYKYGEKQPELNVEDWTFDSRDEDPVMNSGKNPRWNYNKTVYGFSWIDRPDNPKTDLGKRQKLWLVSLKFRTYLYRLADIPESTSGTFKSSGPIDMIEWQSSWCGEKPNEVIGHCQNKGCTKPKEQPKSGN